MPTISEFFGILILMYYNDHAPPHFHPVMTERKPGPLGPGGSSAPILKLKFKLNFGISLG